MKRINIVSKKYDGSPRDEYETFLAGEDSERLLVYSPPGTMSYDHRRQAWFEAPDGLLEIYFKTRWYAVWHICEQHSNLNQVYVHISMPATVTSAGIEWIDLDLDYRIHLDGRIERLDDDDYAANRVKMAYTAELHEGVQAACSEVESLYARRAYPLNHAEQREVYRQIATTA